MKYRVTFLIPHVYEVVAKDEEQAEIEGWKLFQSDENDYIAPDIEITPLEAK